MVYMCNGRAFRVRQDKTLTGCSVFLPTTLSTVLVSPQGTEWPNVAGIYSPVRIEQLVYEL